MANDVEVILATDNVVQIKRRGQHAASNKGSVETRQARKNGTGDEPTRDSPFLSPERACEHFSERTDNHGSASNHDPLWIRRVAAERLACRVVLCGQSSVCQLEWSSVPAGWKARAKTDLLLGKLGGRENEAPPLLGNVTHRRRPRLATIDRRRAVKLDALLVPVVAEEGHVVFPADGGRQGRSGGRSGQR